MFTMRCFVPQRYRFYPDPAAAGSTNAALFANWSVREELDYFNRLRQRTPATAQNVLQLSARRDQLYGPDSAEVSAQYTLTLAQTDTAFRFRTEHPELQWLAESQFIVLADVNLILGGIVAVVRSTRDQMNLE